MGGKPKLKKAPSVRSDRIFPSPPNGCISLKGNQDGRTADQNDELEKTRLRGGIHL